MGGWVAVLAPQNHSARKTPRRSLPLASAEDTRAARGDEADLLSRLRSPRNGRRMGHVLVISASVGVLHRVHTDAADLRPGVALHAVLVEIPARLQDGLVHAPTSRADTDDGAVLRWDALPGAGRQADARLLAVVRVAHDHARAATCACEATTVGSLLLAHGDDGALRHLAEGQAVPDGELRLGAAIDELARVHALDRHPALLPQLEPVGVAEVDLAHGRAAGGVVHDLLHEALDEAVPLDVVDLADLNRTLAEPSLRREDQALALAAAPDNATHGAALCTTFLPKSQPKS